MSNWFINLSAPLLAYQRVLRIFLRIPFLDRNVYGCCEVGFTNFSNNIFLLWPFVVFTFRAYDNLSITQLQSLVCCWSPGALHMRSFGILIISSLCSFYFYCSTVSGESMMQFPDIECFTTEFRKKKTYKVATTGKQEKGKYLWKPMSSQSKNI